LVIAPTSAFPFFIGKPGCTFDHYSGTFKKTLGGP